MSNIFDYLDYRQFLKDSFLEKKALNPNYSHRFVSQRLKLKSSGHLLYVMQGKRKLTERLALKLCNHLKMNRRESEYFMMLIQYAHEKSQNNKQRILEQIIRLKNRVVKQLDEPQYRFYEKWYFTAIREALSTREFKGNYKQLADSLIPPIKESEARKAIALLEKLGLIIVDDRGVYTAVNPLISAGDAWQSITIKNVQMQMLDLSKKAILECPREQRDISNVSISISQSSLELIKQRIANLRSEIMELAKEDKNPDRVIHCAFQVFPLFKTEKENQP